MAVTFSFEPVGRVHSPYKEKFGIPRQPGLVTAANSFIELSQHCNREEICRGLEAFSHIWIVFVFHEAMRDNWKPMVRPPRLGGNEKVGVFASRSPFRPNPIGLSCVELKAITHDKASWCIHFMAGDLLDGTPILDIKPYLPYADAISDARGGFAAEPPFVNRSVEFNESAHSSLLALTDQYPSLQKLIAQVLQQQPQPAYQPKDSQRVYGVRLYDLNVQWIQHETSILVVSITPY